MYTPLKIADWQELFNADLEGELGQKTPTLRRNLKRVLSWALAGCFALIDRRIQWACKQIFPQLCDEDALAYWEGRYGITPPRPVSAILMLTISGSIDGQAIPAGTLWVSEDGGVYNQPLGARIASGLAYASVQALTAGADSTLATGEPLSLASPIPGISGAVVNMITAEGQDAPDLGTRRSQVLDAMRAIGKDGSTISGYRTKALEVAGIVQAFVGHSASGDVTVYPLAALTGPSRIPDAATITALQSYLQDPARVPLGANVYAKAPTARTGIVTIYGATVSDSIKAEINAAITAYFYAAYPRQYSDDVNPTDKVSTRGIWAILDAFKVDASDVSLSISGIGSGSPFVYQIPIGEIVEPGATAWS